MTRSSLELSTFLFARPSLVEGAARLTDLVGVLDEYNYSPSDEAADFYALSNDWRAVAHDLKLAIKLATAK
ncbi:MAG TPA: hypothetical protein VFM06_00855 [Candidatus Limnocylindria bacterium]|nr:hypothetical protein [Candidatus Limnocylindria bacterium]